MKVFANKDGVKNITFKNSCFSIQSDQSTIVIKTKDHSVVLEGEIYRIDQKYCNELSPVEVMRELKNLLSISIEEFLAKIEGLYAIAINYNQENTIRIFRSQGVSYDIFYCKDATSYLVSDSYHDFETKRETNNNSLACVLAEGYCPDRHTQFKNIFRLASDEFLTLSGQGLKKEKLALKIVKINEALSLDTFNTVFTDSLLSRRSKSSNWVEISGGWDSTTLLGALCHHDSQDIHAITTSIKLVDGLHFNKYEVEKAEKISSFYNVPLSTVDYDFSDSSLIDNWYTNVSKMVEHQMFETHMLWRPLMYNIINRDGVEGAACFNSSFSDSIFNFGNSQYVTIMQNSYVFREFMDKMVTYLYGPSFLKTISDQSYSSDYIFKMFNWHFNAKKDDLFETDETNKYNKYLLSFIYGKLGKAVPFSRPGIYQYMKKQSIEEFENFINEHYIEKLAHSLNSENIYFILLELYRHFYLQGGDQKSVLYGLDKSKIQPATPFLDNSLMNFVAQMPESWGRGVDSWSHTKYPLKNFAHTQIKFPHNILSDSKFHAYVHEDDEHKNVNINHELLYNSVFSKELF
ncbi:MAG: hypothetical protein HON94_13040, partial [Methylococcales bacterium]|nr:hypothetical protein [Methylococcales bacterium]